TFIRAGHPWNTTTGRRNLCGPSSLPIIHRLRGTGPTHFMEWLGGIGAADGNRTRVSGLGSVRSTIELQPHDPQRTRNYRSASSEAVRTGGGCTPSMSYS